MSEAVTRVSPIPHGLLGRQGLAIAALLQLVFPPSLFQFKYLPANIDRAGWKEITQGNQPFLGLGFVNVMPKGEADSVFNGVASWMLLTAVRRQGTPKSRFYGDAQGIGVLDMALAAVAVLHGQVAGTGSISVAKVANAVAEAWSEDSAVISLELKIPLTINMADAFTKPGGLGVFEELATTWNVPTDAGGSTDTYTSDWENPND
jgi:hypothetical protein